MNFVFFLGKKKTHKILESSPGLFRTATYIEHSCYTQIIKGIVIISVAHMTYAIFQFFWSYTICLN